jgi:hypothetical protein
VDSVAFSALFGRPSVTLLEVLLFQVLEVLGVLAGRVLGAEIAVTVVDFVRIVIDPLEFVLDFGFSFRLVLVRSVGVVFCHAFGFAVGLFGFEAVECNVAVDRACGVFKRR